MEEVSVILRLNAKPTEETERSLLKVEVESLEDLERLARWLGAGYGRVPRTKKLAIRRKAQVRGGERWKAIRDL